MASDANSANEDGLLRLSQQPQQLENAPACFDKLAPSYTSEPPGTSNRSPGQDPRTEARRILDQKREQLKEERKQSTAYEQFRQHAKDERDRKMGRFHDGTTRVLSDDFYDMTANMSVMETWQQQGIWNREWNLKNVCSAWVWKHEGPMEPVFYDETDSEASMPDSASHDSRPRRAKPWYKVQREHEDRRRDHNASRPFPQFIYQLKMERDRLRRETENHTYSHDVNTRAYTNIQNLWRKRHLWDDKWGIMPGMSWRHEQPWEEALAEYGLESDAEENEAEIQAPLSDAANKSSSLPSISGPITETNVAASNEIQAGAHENSANPVSGPQSIFCFTPAGRVDLPLMDSHCEANKSPISEQGETSMVGLGNDELGSSDDTSDLITGTTDGFGNHRVAKAKATATTGTKRPATPELTPSNRTVASTNLARRSPRLQRAAAKSVTDGQGVLAQRRPKRAVTRPTKPQGNLQNLAAPKETGKRGKRKMARKE